MGKATETEKAPAKRRGRPRKSVTPAPEAPKRKRGRPRKHPLPAPPPPVEPSPETTSNPAEPEVEPLSEEALNAIRAASQEVAANTVADALAGTNANMDALIKALGKSQAEQVVLEARRAAMMEKIARYRWLIAQHFHRLENGDPLDFERYPFQKEMYQCDNPYMVVVGSVQWGKTEFLICTAIAMAMCGLGVFYVIDKYEKRDKIVQSRIDPTLRTVPFYRELMETAKQRGATTDSARYKAIGAGFVNFVGSNSPGDFSSYKADAAIIDEHQLCEQDNIAKIDFRMKGSDWRFRVIVGNPRGKGSDDNQNLDWEFRKTDMRKWHVPCDRCGKMQILGWWTHFVVEHRNESGAIISAEWRDTDWSPEKYPLDMRPICPNCGAAMNRLHPEAEWQPTNPGAQRAGFQLSNLSNPKTRMDELWEQYAKARHNQTRMQDFINDELGESHSLDGIGITDQMLQAASTGTLSGVQPYSLKRAAEIVWRPLREAR